MSMFDIYGQDFLFGKTYPEPCQAPENQIEGQTLGAFSKKFAELRIKMPQFLCLRGGAWSTSGCIMGDGYSVAWRVHDAQFWGVPQRRKRIALVADFGGLSAPEILFEREGLSGNTTESREQGQGTATTSEGNIAETISFQERAGCDGGAKESSYNATESEPCQHLTTNQYCKVYGISPYDSNAMKSANPHSGIYEADTSRTLDLNGGSPACNQGGMVVLEGNGSRPSHQGDGYKEGEVSYTLNSTEQHAVCYETVEGGGRADSRK